MTYRVTLRPAAARELGRLRGPVQVALHGAIFALGGEPRPRGALKLSGRDGMWRVRVNLEGAKWRIVYTIDDGLMWVRVLRVARRDEATYRRLR